MAKCCSFQGARWAACEEVMWGEDWKDAKNLDPVGWVQADTGWLTALHRGKQHRLQDLDMGKACSFAAGF